MKNIEVNDPELVEPQKGSPIQMCNVDYSISTRGKSLKHTVKNIILKGDIVQISSNRLSLKRIMTAHFKDQNDAKKKAHVFDYSRLSILNVEFIKLIGYGISRI